MTKTLMLLQHAESSRKDLSLDDFDRPLNKEGIKEAKTTGLFLKDMNLTPDLILTSPAKRALETSELVTKYSGYQGEVKKVDSFYRESNEQGEINAAADITKSVLLPIDDGINRLMIVGHNPFLEDLLNSMHEIHTHMRTCDLAMISLEIESWKDFDPRNSENFIGYWRKD